MLEWQRQQQQHPQSPAQHPSLRPSHTGNQLLAPTAAPSKSYEISTEEVEALDARIMSDLDNVLWPLYFPGECV